MGSDQELICMKTIISVQSIRIVIVSSPNFSLVSLTLPSQKREACSCHSEIVRLLLSLSPRYQTVGTRSPISIFRKRISTSSFLFWSTSLLLPLRNTRLVLIMDTLFQFSHNDLASVSFTRQMSHRDKFEMCPIVPTNRSRESTCSPDNASFRMNRW